MQTFIVTVGYNAIMRFTSVCVGGIIDSLLLTIAVVCSWYMITMIIYSCVFFVVCTTLYVGVGSSPWYARTQAQAVFQKTCATQWRSHTCFNHRRSQNFVLGG